MARFLQKMARPDPKCIGFGINCQNESNQGFDYCNTCFLARKQKLDDGFCVGKNGSCHHKKHQQHNWCTECYLEKRVDEAEALASKRFKAHDCNRGGVVCTTCDNIMAEYDAAVDVLASFRKKRRAYIRGKQDH